MFHRVVLLSAAIAALSFGASWDVVASGGIGLTKSNLLIPNEIDQFLPFGDRGVAAGVNVGLKLVDLGVGKLELEVPFVASAADRIGISALGIEANAWSLYMTPGARFRVGNNRASVFGSFGAGVARDQGLNTRWFSAGDSSHFALGYAAGADLRIVGPLKVRGEIRGFSVKGTNSWSNRPFLMGGVGLEF